jgi:hypothetical protein
MSDLKSHPLAEIFPRLDGVAKAEAAHYRLTARMRELEQQFEAKASELRAAYLRELGVIFGAEDE